MIIFPLQCYLLEYRIDTDPSFITAEKNFDYSLPYLMGCLSGYSDGSWQRETIQFQSSFAIDGQYTDNCGEVGDFTILM